MGILVGDIGGTKTVLAMAEVGAQRVRIREERRFSSAEFASLGEMVTLFLDQTGVTCESAAFAVAGPVHGDRSRITNLSWDIDVSEIGRSHGWAAARLLNDLEAVAWGIPALAPDDLCILHAGERGARGNACVVAAGTGLGEAGMYWDGARHRPFATEGGHADFSPSDERELELLGYLSQRYGPHVSWERVVSGMGIRNLYEFLCSRGEGQASSGPLRATSGEDLAAAVSAGAASGRCRLCVEAMELFASLYGREAGNMALKHMALGGVYLAGGIAPKNLELLRRPAFLEAFFDKGRMAPLMQRMRVSVILEQRVPLFGAARFMVDA
jgi:glucokinase